MWKRRRVWAIVASLLLACVGATLLGRSLYLRSDRYRRAIEERLGKFFGMPVQVGSVRPLGWDSRELQNVEVWLPDRRDRVFQCPRAVWEINGNATVRLEAPTITIGSENWEREDYGRVLRASLAHDFERAHVHEVRMEGASLIWPRRDFQLRADGLRGSIIFDPGGVGQASFVAGSINGAATPEPITITARVDPRDRDLLPEVLLVVPKLPLTTLGLAAVLQSEVTQGSFAGKIRLLQSPAGDRIQLSGTLQDVRLEELTRRMPGGPVTAIVDLTIDDAEIYERSLQHVRFHGNVRQLQIDSVLPRIGLPPMGGSVRLTVQHGEISNGHLTRLHTNGQWTGGSLEALTRTALGRGGVRGQLRVGMDSLLIENDRLTSGQLEISAEPPPDGVGTVDRGLLLEQVQKLSGLRLPENLLPASVEFVHLGTILIIDHDRVRVLSGRGPAGRALITAQVFGQNLPLLPDLDQTFSLDPLLARAGKRVQELTGAVQKRLGRTTTRPAIATRPSSAPH